MNLNGHFSLENPSLGHRCALRPVVISDDHIDFTCSQPAHRHAPLDGSGERHGEDAFILRNFAAARKEQQAFVEGSTGAVNGGVLDAQSVVITHFEANLGQIT